MSVRLQFLGGAGTVTGSKYLLETPDCRILVDCGLFQGYKPLRLRNWAPLPVDPGSIQSVVLTHAHLDHSGYLPVLTREGFGGRVMCSEATRSLCGILLPDSGYLQERDAEFANRHGFSKHHPARPLYTQLEAEAVLDSFDTLPYGQARALGKGLEMRLDPAGHILGSAIVTLRVGGLSIVFSGDLGRLTSPLMPAPVMIGEADYLVVESTYGGRRHSREDPEALLADIVKRTSARGGTVLVPAFAVGRAQLLLYYLEKLKREERIPDLPIFLDSPMAIDASDIYCTHRGEHRLTEKECRRACAVARYVRSVEESKSLDTTKVPMVIVSASGMATGGRVLHHLKRFAPDPRSTILFSGYQAGGTRGASMLAGAEQIKIHGSQVPLRAEVKSLDMLSAHADEDEIMTWLRHFRRPPRATFITHGEPDASDALRRRIQDELGWYCVIPEHREERVLE